MLSWPELLLSCVVAGTLLRVAAAEAVVVTTWSAEGFQRATSRAWKTFKETGDRMEALLEGLSECERLQCDGTVGFGGSPDETGETRLDALVFDGPGHKMGAVGSMGRIKDAARVAFAVMNYTKHSMIVGDAATRFAIEMGFREEPLYTNGSREVQKAWEEQSCQPNFRTNVVPDARFNCGPYRPAHLSSNRDFSNEVRSKIGRFAHDTISMIVVDEEGRVSAGTSTNGASHKVPGRIGDSPIPGAGAYVDEEVGAAAATGDGDIMMRFLPSYQAVEGMRQGMKPGKAAAAAVARIAKSYANFSGAVIAVTVNGEHGAACHGMSTFTYSLQNAHFINVKLFTVKCL